MSKRDVVFARDGNKCVCCGSNDNLTLDHIVPKALGGLNRSQNYQTLCWKCNNEKGATIALYVKHRKVVNYVRGFIKEKGLQFAGQ